MPSLEDHLLVRLAVKAGHEVLLIDVSEPVPGLTPVLYAMIRVHKESDQIRLECFQPNKDGMEKQTAVSSITFKTRGERQMIAPHNFKLSLVPSDKRVEVYRLINDYLYPPQH